MSNFKSDTQDEKDKKAIDELIDLFNKATGMDVIFPDLQGLKEKLGAENE